MGGQEAVPDPVAALYHRSLPHVYGYSPGVAVSQALIEDPSGNPVELFGAVRPEARLSRQ